MSADERPAGADPTFDRIARIIRDALRVPTGAVTLVDTEQQVFIGAAGLPTALGGRRTTPLSHSLCQHVVASDRPLIVSDARHDPQVQDNGAVRDYGIVAYAGFPMRNPDGVTIGSVCAMDAQPRTWEPWQLELIDDLAQVCATEIALRASRDEVQHLADLATDMTARAHLLLSCSEALADTSTHLSIAQALQEVVAKNLDCRAATLWVLDPRDAGRLDLVGTPGRSVPVTGSNPLGAVLIDAQPSFLDAASLCRRFPTCEGWAVELGLVGDDGGSDAAVAVLPLLAAGRTRGALVLSWRRAIEFSDTERATLAALSSYAAQAISRAHLFEERAGVSHTLQTALLTDLPAVQGMQLAARYRPAAEHDEVGGDWYDALVMPDGTVHLTVGDVMGHDISAAAVMGGLRNMLRAFAWGQEDAPSTNVRRLDRAARDMHVRSYATLVFARVEQDDVERRTGTHTLRWTNAGHPPPLLLHPDGRTEILGGDGPADPMLGVRPDRRRRDQTASMPPGSTLLLYTDGLVETREMDVDQGIELLRAALGAHTDLDVDGLLDTVLDELVGATPADDVVLLAARF